MNINYKKGLGKDVIKHILKQTWKWTGFIQRAKDKCSQIVVNWVPIYKKHR